MHTLVKCVVALGERRDGNCPADELAQSEKLLAQLNARYLTYDELIQRTRDSYRDYIDANKKISRLRELIEKL